MINLRTKAFYLLLLPLFFLLHAIAENFDLINYWIVARLLITYYFITAVIYGISYLFLRDHRKSALITLLLMTFYFFFSAFHEFLKVNSPIPFLGKYVFVLPFSIILLILIFVLLIRTRKNLERFNLLLNTLLIIYIVLDLSILAWKSVVPTEYNLSTHEFPEFESARISDTIARPDIYFLMLDEYAGSESLKSKYGFINPLDSFLIRKDFNVLPGSRSNYNLSGFSVASILNMSYIRNFKNPDAATAGDYVACNYLIRNNRVTTFLERNGYEILNYSIFDLKNHPALTEQYFLPQTEKIITERTFFNRLLTDIGWHLYRLNLPVNPQNRFIQHINNNKLFLSLVNEAASKKSKSPRFIYVHLLLPHYPFFYDKEGNERDPKIVYNENDFNDPAAYLGYVEYTNGIMQKTIDTILQNNPKAVIILMGDHGYRRETSEPHPAHHFNNLNAVYYPDKEYDQLYNNISGVNQFRSVFNKLFDQNFPLATDSTIFIQDRKGP